jgi:hypothetical protein
VQKKGENVESSSHPRFLRVARWQERLKGTGVEMRHLRKAAGGVEYEARRVVDDG